jgi:molybdate transport system substrate-binding protein
MIPRRTLAALALAVAVSSVASHAAHADSPLTVAAAASLRDPVESGFERFRDGAAELVLTSGASAVLAQQARRGAPIDVLISASPREIDALVRDGFAIEGSRRAIASDRLIVVVPASDSPPATLDDVITGTGRIAVGNPRTAPLGRYTRDALASLGAWDALKPRLVYGQDARHVLGYVAEGEVSAGIVYEAQAALVGDRVRPGPRLDASLHPPVTYEGVVLRDASDPALARAFLDWLASPEGRELFASRGYRLPT